MQRLVNQQFAELIGLGIELIPKPIYQKLYHVEFFTGTDPFYAGLKDIEQEQTPDGRSSRNTWHCSYPWNQSTQNHRTTIVMPSMLSESDYPIRLQPLCVVHELAHALDEVLDFRHDAVPVTNYAKTNRLEAFADAFTFWLFPGYGEYYEIINPLGMETQALFEQLLEA